MNRRRDRTPTRRGPRGPRRADRAPAGIGPRPRSRGRGGRGAPSSWIARELGAHLPTLDASRRVVAHLGPTNSGKTYAALQVLAGARSGAYGAPLRLLAQEVHERLGEWVGAERVGLRTGEERINDHAPLLACTTELLPAREIVVLDEAHWVADAERGDAWTRALLGLPCSELHVVGSPDVLPVLRAAVPDLELRTYERLAPLSYIGPVDLRDLEPGTVLVAFSRRAVLALAREVSMLRRTVAVLYGAMPVAERRRQAGRFVRGEAEIVCATDVLGHGVNLPARVVLFAETEKWNGRERRDLAAWEVAQIAGRAGRFGLHDNGYVGILVGHGWASPSGAVVQRGLVPTVELEPGVLGFRSIESARLGPELSDLGDLPPVLWVDALRRWSRVGRERFSRVGEWLRIADVEPIVARLAAIGPQVLPRLAGVDAWALALAPVDVEKPGKSPLLARLARAVVGDEDLRDLIDVGQLRGLGAEGAEAVADGAALLRWFTRRWPGAGRITSGEADALEAAAAAVISRALAREIRTNSFGRCVVCGRPAVPGRSRCDVCWSRGRWAGRDTPAGDGPAATGRQTAGEGGRPVTRTRGRGSPGSARDRRAQR